jgi:quercetin dioxygenase-like cupin family protein
MNEVVVYSDNPVSNWFQSLVAEKTGTAVTKEMSPMEIREKICLVEDLMRQSKSAGEMVDTVDSYPLKHTFTDGVYVREMTIPAGHLVVGKIHKHNHLNFISKGRVTVITEKGGVEELVAPVTLISPAGVKRLLFTHEDTVWTVVHVTTETDVEKIEDLVIAKNYPEFTLLQARDDYKRVLAETGMTDKQLVCISENVLDQTTLKDNPYDLYIDSSPIAGKGVFTKRDIPTGSTIGLARVNGKRTILGRYVNHSNKPNATLEQTDTGDLITVALTPILSGEELLCDYRQGAKQWGATFNLIEVEKTRRLI